jgi:hypothetical protein
MAPAPKRKTAPAASKCRKAPAGSKPKKARASTIGKRPDRAIKTEANKDVDKTSVKMTLSSFCSNSELATEIDHLVRGVTAMSIEASRFLNFHLLKRCEERKEIPTMKQSFFYSAFTMFATKSDGHNKVSEHSPFAKNFKVFTRDRPDIGYSFEGLTANISYAAKEYMINCQNHVVCNINGRVKKAFKIFWDETILTAQPQFRAPDRNLAMNHFMRRLNIQDTAQDMDALWPSFTLPPTAATQTALRTYIEGTVQRYKDLPLDIDKTAVNEGTNRVATKWWAYLPWLYDIQVILQGHEMVKHFSLLPICCFDPKHITIDNTALHQLLTRIAKRLHLAKPPAMASFINPATNRALWMEQFDLEKTENTNGSKVFGFYLKTDGYAVSVTLNVPKKNVPKKPKKNKSADPPPALDLTDKRVIGVDPGRRDLISAAYEDLHGEFHFSRYSNKEYQEKIGVRKAAKARERWMSNANLKERMTQLPTTKTSRSDDLLTHIRALYPILIEVLELNCRRRVRSQRFSQYCVRQRVMNAICNRITKGNPDDKRIPVVAFGAAVFNSSSKGHRPGPVKAIRTALKRKGVIFRDVDEDYTSQLCNECHVRLIPMYCRGGRELYEVRRCLTVTCRKTYNRDANAAINMKHIFEYENEHGRRPAVFTQRLQNQLRQGFLAV